MTNISPHCTYKEATFSPTAIANGIDNTPDTAQLYAMQAVAGMVFEPLRKWVGNPIRITSFFRSAKLNKKVGGAASSQHRKGEAMDLDMDGLSGATNAQMFEYIRKNLPFDQLIWEHGNDRQPDWVHVSYVTQGINRRNVLRARRVGGSTVYTTWKPQ